MAMGSTRRGGGVNRTIGIAVRRGGTAPREIGIEDIRYTLFQLRILLLFRDHEVLAVVVVPLRRKRSY